MFRSKTSSIITEMLLAGVFICTGASSYADCDEKQGTISIQGYSSVKAQPDVAYVRVAATVQSESAETARKAVEKSVSAFIDGLKKDSSLKDSIRKDDGSIKAESISVNPDYVYDSKTSERRVSGYSASRTVVVKIRDFEQISKVLDIAVASGINNIYDISYELENPAPVMEKARLDAVADAASKARQITGALGVRLGTIASISYNTPSYGASHDYVQPRMMSKGMMMSNSAADSAVYSPDKLVFTDNVSVVYNLEQTKKN